MRVGRDLRLIATGALLVLGACSSSSNDSQSSANCIDGTSELSVDNESSLDVTISVSSASSPTSSPASMTQTKTFLAPAGESTEMTVPAGFAVIDASLVDDAKGGAFQIESFQLVCGGVHHVAIEPRADVLVDVEREGQGFGKMTSDPPGIDCSMDGSTDHCSAFFPFGTSLSLTSIADVGSFSSDGTQTFVLTEDEHVFASFNPQATSIQITESGNGFGSIHTIPYLLGGECLPGATSCSAFFENGTDVTIVAEPTTGSVLTTFTGDCSGTSCTIHVDNSSPANVGVVFTLEKETLTASITGSGMGDLDSFPDGLVCNSPVVNSCSGQFDYGTQVNIQALPATGSKLAAWGGACAGTDPAANCSVSLIEATNATADFEAQ